MNKYIALVVLLLLPFSSFATSLGSVVDFSGKVTLHQKGTPRGKKVKQAPVDIPATMSTRTYAKSQAKIKLADGSKILMTENSTLEFQDDQNIFVGSGRVLFSITKRDATRSLNILTETAVIGVKGTMFLVEASDDGALLHLEEGSVEVESIRKEFEEFKSEFERFKKSYKAEYAAFKKSITMKPQTTISIDQRGLKQIATPERIKELFNELKNF